MKKNFPSWPSYTKAEAAAVSKVLLSNKVNYWTGDNCKKFESDFAKHTDSKYAISICNGTLALEVCLIALGIGKGDDVIVTPRSFFASVSCILRVGANPVFADVSLDSQNITLATIEKALTKKTKAIICVHLAGWPCEMNEIVAFAKKNNLRVIEDCAQAHGAKLHGKSVGSFGDISAWSFCQDKIISTAGEGGMITTNDEDLHHKARSLKDHGKDFTKLALAKKSFAFNYVHSIIGTNARMTEIQATVGRHQLKKLKKWHQKRNKNARSILEFCSTIDQLRVPTIPHHIDHAFYKCYVFLNSALSSERETIINRINEHGVPCYSGSCPEIYLESAIHSFPDVKKDRLQNAELLGKTSLMFLCHPTLKKSDIEFTQQIIKKVFSDYNN